jgi:regulator of sigma E protease
MLGEQIPIGKVVVQSVAVATPAEQAGIRAGDILLSLQGQPIRNTGELTEMTKGFRGQEVTLELEREGQKLSVKLTPRVQFPSDQGAMGVGIAMQDGYALQTVRYPPGKAILLGLRDLWTLLSLTVSGFASLFRVGLKPNTITGPIGIFEMSGVVARTGLVNLMRFTALLSVNLFVINLIPLPVLDGGQVVLVLLEKLRGGKPMSERYTQLIGGVSWLLLGTLVILVTYMDIVRISSGISLLP